MSTKLKTKIGNVRQAFSETPQRAAATFSVAAQLNAGLKCETRMRTHEVIVDEPSSLGGEDAGPNPVELVLAALAACQEITYKAYAAALDIPIEGITIKLDGDIDLRGFLGLDDSVRSGFHTISGTVDIQSSASAEQLKSLKETVDAHCPVLDMLTVPVKVALALNTPGENS